MRWCDGCGRGGGRWAWVEPGVGRAPGLHPGRRDILFVAGRLRGGDYESVRGDLFRVAWSSEDGTCAGAMDGEAGGLSAERGGDSDVRRKPREPRSEEHTSELQSHSF